MSFITACLFLAACFSFVADEAAQVTLNVQPTSGFGYSLWHAATLDSLSWSPLTSPVLATHADSTVTPTDIIAVIQQQFYRLAARTP
jgi:hypothetical protein